MQSSNPCSAYTASLVIQRGQAVWSLLFTFENIFMSTENKEQCRSAGHLPPALVTGESACRVSGIWSPTLIGSQSFAMQAKGL